MTLEQPEDPKSSLDRHLESAASVKVGETLFHQTVTPLSSKQWRGEKGDEVACVPRCLRR